MYRRLIRVGGEVAIGGNAVIKGIEFDVLIRVDAKFDVSSNPLLDTVLASKYVATSKIRAIPCFISSAPLQLDELSDLCHPRQFNRRLEWIGGTLILRNNSLQSKLFDGMWSLSCLGTQPDLIDGIIDAPISLKDRATAAWSAMASLECEP